MDKRGYYKILNLKPQASEAEVKRAYSRAILDYHPDMGKITKKVKAMSDGPEKDKKVKEIEEKIRKLNEAKTILSDPEKKKLYDQGIDENAQAGFDMGGFDIFDFFNGGMGGRRRERGPSKVADTEFHVKLTLKDAFLGRKKTFHVKREVICFTCSGRGGEKSTVCPKCNGEGEIAIKKQMGFMFSIDHQKCDNCQGKGNVVQGPLCHNCKGRRYVTKKESISVEFKKGFKHGETIIVKGKGDEHVGALSGDLVLIAQIEQDPFFRRINNHLVVQADIELYTALVGGTISLRHVDGTVLNVEIDKINNLREDVILVRGAGFPGGDLFIEPNFITKQMDINKLKSYLSIPRNSPSGMMCRGASSKLPTQTKSSQRERTSATGGFKESIFSQFFSGF